MQTISSTKAISEPVSKEKISVLQGAISFFRGLVDVITDREWRNRVKQARDEVDEIVPFEYSHK